MPRSYTHLNYLLTGDIPPDYLYQMMWQMACMPEREWCDFMSYDPRFPDDHLRRFIKRVPRNNELISNITTGVTKFLIECEELHTKLVHLEPTN